MQYYYGYTPIFEYRITKDWLVYTSIWTYIKISEPTGQ